MIQNYILVKGVLTKDSLEILHSNTSLNEEDKTKITENLIPKIPDFVFQTKEPRTLLLEDTLGYNILKVFNEEGKLPIILVRIEERFYTPNELKKISLDVNQFLDNNLEFTKLNEKIEQILIKIDTYDFSRPIKLLYFNDIWVNDKEKGQNIDEILPKVNELQYAEAFSEILKYNKLRFLLNSKKKRVNYQIENILEISDVLLKTIEEFQGDNISEYDKGCIIYNFGFLLRDLQFFEESNHFFIKAAKIFSKLKIENLEIFSYFNVGLNYKQLKQLSSALDHLLEKKDIIVNSKLLSKGFKGIYFRHVGEIYQQNKDYKNARNYYSESLSNFEDEKQVNRDVALNYLALGTINYNEHDYFDASKYFSFAANILNFLNQDITDITKNLGVSFFNLSNEYLRTVKVLMIEKDLKRIIDFVTTGLSYFFLANLYLGNQLLDNFKNLLDLYSKAVEKIPEMDIKEESKIKDSLIEILRDYSGKLSKGIDEKAIKSNSKKNFEAIKAFQPLKTYYVMILYKGNGVSIHSKTSTTLKELPELDENLIAGMISAINSFLGEVLRSEENLSLIDRHNVKIMLEYSDHLIGLCFSNKESPKIRDDLKGILLEMEDLYKVDFENWDGGISKFTKVPELADRIVK